MNYQNLCINCMHEKASPDAVCPYCGRNNSSYSMPAFVLPPFTILNKHYLLGRVLGVGGFGITYIAMDMVLQRVVAVKEFFMQGYMFRTGNTSMSVTKANMNYEQESIYTINREKFEKEAKLLASLDDLPGVVKVYDFFYENSTSYMALEYLEGKTLDNYVKQAGGRISAEEIVQKMIPAMKSLQLLHERGILHRDISPDNIMVMADGSMELFDFGGAKVRSQRNNDAVVMAKKGYTPIEQYDVNGNQGAWTDVYAMAATMYYCICGKAPVQVMARQSDDDLILPSAMGISIHPSIEAAIKKGLSISPANRYQSMTEFIAALCASRSKVKDRKKQDEGKEKKAKQDHQNKQNKTDTKRSHDTAGKSSAVSIVLGSLLTVSCGLLACTIGFGMLPSLDAARPSLTGSEITSFVNNVIFDEENALVLKGSGLGKVDGVYVNGEKQRVTICEQNDGKLAVLLPQSAYAEEKEIRIQVSRELGLIPVKSAELSIEILDGEDSVPAISGADREEIIRPQDTFLLKVSGSNITKNTKAIVGGEVASGGPSTADQVVWVCVDKEYLNACEEQLEIKLVEYTEDGHRTSRESEPLFVDVRDIYDEEYTACQEWQDVSTQIVNVFDNKEFMEGKEASEAIAALYKEGTRIFKMSLDLDDRGELLVRNTSQSAKEVTMPFDTMMKFLNAKEDAYFIADISYRSEAAVRSFYDGIKNSGVNLQNIILQLHDQDSVGYALKRMDADQVGLIFNLDDVQCEEEEIKEFLQNSGVQTISFDMNSKWNNEDFIGQMKDKDVAVYIDSVNDYNIERVCLEQGAKGVFTERLTQANYELYRNAQGSVTEQSEMLLSLTEPSDAEEYMNRLGKTDFTILIAGQDTVGDIRHLEDGMKSLKLRGSCKDIWRGGYLAVSKAGEGIRKVVFEKSTASESPDTLKFDYEARDSVFIHMESSGAAGENKSVIALNGQNYSQYGEGLNIVVYDEVNHMIIDSVTISHPDPNLEEPELYRLHDYSDKSVQTADNVDSFYMKDRICDYFHGLTDNSRYKVFIVTQGDAMSLVDDELMDAMAGFGIREDYRNLSDMNYIGICSGGTFSKNDLSAESLTSYYMIDEGRVKLTSTSADGAQAGIQLNGEDLISGKQGMHMVVYDAMLGGMKEYCWIDFSNKLQMEITDLTK